MVDLTVLELHLDVDAEDLPFGDQRASTPDSPTDTGAAEQPARPEAGLRERIPVRLLVGLAVLLLAVGAVVAVRLIDRDTDNLGEAF
jgi:hypothetical protein